MTKKVVLPYNKEFLSYNNNLDSSYSPNDIVENDQLHNIDYILTDNDLIFSMYEKDLKNKIDNNLQNLSKDKEIKK